MTAVDLNTFRPATDLLIGNLRETLAQIAGHDHPQAEAQSWKDRHTALADEFAAEIDRFQPAAYESGEHLFMHSCRNVEWWDEARQGPINEQGCDGCESAPYPDGWRPVYVLRDGAELRPPDEPS